MEKIGIFYGSSTGNTETVAEKLQELLGADNVELFDVADASASDVEGFSNLILGTSTWGVGDLQDDFETFLPSLKEVNLAGKAIALYGLGDQETYSDTYVDGMGEVYEQLEGKGCKFVGFTSTDGYDFEESRAVKDDKFVGLALDEDNQSDESEGRIEAWVEALKSEMN